MEGAAQRTDVPQVPQESDTFRQSDVLVEARQRAVHHHGQSPAPTCQPLHAPVSENPFSGCTTPDDVFVPDGLVDVLAVREVRQHESCPEHTCHSR